MAAGQVEFGEEARSAGLIHQLIYMRQGLHGPLSDGVEPRKSWQKRHVPSGFRAKMTEAACEALDGTIQP